MPHNAPDVTLSHERPPHRIAVLWWLAWAGWGLLVVLGLTYGAFALPWSASRMVVALLLLGGGTLALRQWLPWHIRRTLLASAAALGLLLATVVGVRTFLRYSLAEVMEVPVREYSNAEYPEDPAGRSVHHGKYNGRQAVAV